MILYHVTHRKAAESIQKNGFKDSSGYYGLSTTQRGVFFSDKLLDGNDVPLRQDEELDSFFKVDIDEKIINSYEWVHDYTAFREWCIPSEIINKHFMNRTIYDWYDDKNHTNENSRYRTLTPAKLKEISKKSKHQAKYLKIVDK